MKYFPNKEKEIGKLNFSQLFFIANSLSSFLHTTQSTVIKLYHGHTHFYYTIHLCIYVESHMHVCAHLQVRGQCCGVISLTEPRFWWEALSHLTGPHHVCPKIINYCPRMEESTFQLVEMI